MGLALAIGYIGIGLFFSGPPLIKQFPSYLVVLDLTFTNINPIIPLARSEGVILFIYNATFLRGMVLDLTL